MRTATQRKSKPQFHDSLKMRGYLEYVLRDARTGEIVRRGRKENTVQFGGRGWALKRLVSDDAVILSSIAIGTASAAPTSSDNSLAGYTTLVAFGTTGLTTSTNAACTFTAAVSFDSSQTFTGSTSIGEFGIYNSNATSGSAQLFNRLNTSPVINFGTTNTLAITITITN